MLVFHGGIGAQCVGDRDAPRQGVVSVVGQCWFTTVALMHSVLAIALLHGKGWFLWWGSAGLPRWHWCTVCGEGILKRQVTRGRYFGGAVLVCSGDIGAQCGGEGILKQHGGDFLVGQCWFAAGTLVHTVVAKAF